MNATGFILITIMDLSAAAIIFTGALSERMRLYPVWHKVGLITAVVGLVCQSIRNLQFVFTGHSPSDADMPLWVLKDAGIAIIAYYYAYMAITSHFSPKPVVKSKRAKAK